ncbi:DUF928 domain-containing protein [Laspinema olomoucense]|uniref:DUF928 domain-containing protein n=2 Tax=Laspinema TaxID=2584823 RepID=A0ABT2N9H3_9CYAN|nr:MULTISPECIES: DUF928 domain-containing protein [unclassified Laspinema]MCT7971773.1 DUF928 domain-containing protein [Laspinema sp. D3d]MCT7979348.1 DUF928 domain-containing protein [Laspinema sp. D3b]MCT7989147.1 DUF928 domain-containing protein [Laspinema sp. D3a]MCT7993379.1 DUF928 domain-containing protein [Laspinema sp. D3c]
MNHRPRIVIPSFMFATLAGAVALSALAQPVQAESVKVPALISLQFKPPGDPVPATSVGGGTRGNVRFAPPGESAPVTSVGGGTRGNVRFAPPGEAAPVTSVGGGSRGNEGTLTQEGQGLEAIALLPASQHGRTMSARPTFFVYVPPTATEKVFFSIQDKEGNHHYQTTLEINGGGSIVSFTLPETAPELELETDYLWFFVPLDASGRLQPDSYSVTGWVKRVAAIPTTGDLEALSLATAYAEAGVWYDTLTTLAVARVNQPDNLTVAEEWRSLLGQVGLEAIAATPVMIQSSP